MRLKHLLFLLLALLGNATANAFMVNGINYIDTSSGSNKTVAVFYQHRERFDMDYDEQPNVPSGHVYEKESYWSDDDGGWGWYYNYYYSDYEGNISIPSTVTDAGTTYQVTSVYDYAFCNCTAVTSITLPNSIISIGNCAFWNCRFLTSVAIPSSVTSIGSSAFSSCSNLTSVKVDIDSPLSINYSTFTNRANATLYVPYGSKAAYQAANYWQDFKEIVEPAIVDFADANVKALCVANWDTDNDGELSEEEAAAVTSLGSVFKGNTTITSFNELQYFTGLTEIRDSAFYFAKKLKSIIIPQNVTRIGKRAFENESLHSYNESELESVQLPDGLITIDDYAFWSCKNLKSINFPANLKTINKAAFHEVGIESLTFPEGLEKIGYSAFNFCNSLTSIYIPSTVNEIGFASFVGCPRMSSIVVAESNPMYDSRSNCNAIIETSTNTLIQGCQSSTIPEGVTSIGEAAFQGCKYGLTSVTIPNGITNIGSGAFSGCDFLEYVSIPMSVTSIGTYAFYQAFGLTNLKEVYCYASTPPEAYIYCPEPVIDEYHYLPEGDHYAFNIDYLRLATLHVPAASLEAYSTTAPWSYFGSIVAIEDDVKNIDFADANVKALCVANWDTNSDGELSEAEAAAVTDLGEVFKNDTTITSFNELQYFTGLTEIPSSAFYNCQYLNEVIIPENVTTIGINAFYCCFRLSSITVPEGVTTIDWLAFQGCYGLHSIHIPASVTNIGMRAFMSTPGQILNLGSRWPSVRESITVAEGNTVYDSRGNCNAIIETATNTLMYGCSNTIIPSGVRIIDGGAFANTALTSIVIPNSVDSISGGAFAYCKELISVRVESEVPIALGRRPHPFSGINANAILYVPAGSKAAYETAGWNTSFSEIVEMEDTSPKITNLLSNKWSGAEYSVQAATFDSGVNYGDWNDSNPNYNQIVGVPEADANGRNWYDVDYTCNWQEMTAPLNNWCQDGNFGDIYARRTFYYDEEMPEELFLACGHDDAPCEYYLNGELIWSVTDGWFEQEIYKLTSAQKALLRPGELNVLAFHVHQNYGGMYADCGLYTSLSEMGISNKCGDNLIWSFNGETGTLTISGTGDMYDFSYYSEDIPNTPWVGIRNLIKHIDVQDGATRIGSDAFLECSALTSVTLPNSVTSIGGNAFVLCTALTSVTIPEGVTTIDHSAFRDSGLETIVFPNSVTSIGDRVFEGCSNLTSVTMSDNVITFDGDFAFGESNNIESVYITSLATWLETSFERGNNPLRSGAKLYLNNVEVTDLVIPEGTTAILKAAFEGCESLTSVSIPNSVTSIDGWAFAKCNNLTSATIPASVTSIGDDALAYCSSLTDVYCYADSVPTTGNWVFTDTPITSATLHVPAASLEQYKTTAPWSGFGTIVPIEEPGIEVTDISQLDNAIYIEPFVARIDANNKMEICLKNAGNVSGYVFELVLPEGVTVATDNDGNCIDELTNRHNGQQSFFNNLGENRYRFGCLGTNSLTGSDGAIHVLTIHVDENMPEGVYAIEIRDVSLSNTNGQMVEVPSTTTSVSIEKCQLGDVNANGKIDIGDAVTIANHLVGKPTYNFVERASDTNGNGTPADIGDAVTIALYLVGKPCNLSNSVKEWNENETEPQ